MMTSLNDDSCEGSIAERVRRTLQSLDHVSVLEPGPYFTAGVVHRLSATASDSRSPLSQFIMSRRLRTVLLTAMLLANLATAYIALHGSSATYSREQYIESMADRYQLNFPSLSTTSGKQ